MENPDRRNFLKSFGALAFVGISGPLFLRSAARRAPNILVLQPDQFRADFMGCAGNKQVKTPNLDRLAREGIRFSHCFSSSPVCCPFRASFQTGLYQHMHGVTKNGIQLSPSHTTFAEILKKHGYATGYIGKWHLDGHKRKKKTSGFIPAGERRQGWDDWHGHLTGHDYFNVQDFDKRGNKIKVAGYDWEPTWHTDMALAFAKRNKGKPWAYYVSYGPPHKPEDCPDKFLKMYDPDKFNLPPDIQKAGFSRNEEASLRKVLHNYYGQISSIDHEVGRILDGLKKIGQDRNTIIIFTSDHGDTLGSHCDPSSNDYRGKGAPYQTTFRIPLLIRWPDQIKENQITDSIVSCVDFASTILDLAGINPPAKMQGISLKSRCLLGEGTKRQAIYIGLGKTRNKGWRAAWNGRYIYEPLFYKVLYDHKEDPYETRNLFAISKYKKIKERMQTILISLARKTEDPMLTVVMEVNSK